MLQKIDFEPVSDKTKLVEMNIFAVAENVVSNKLVLNSVYVELSHSGQIKCFSIILLMKQKKANISNDGGCYCDIAINQGM